MRCVAYDKSPNNNNSVLCMNRGSTSASLPNVMLLLQNQGLLVGYLHGAAILCRLLRTAKGAHTRTRRSRTEAMYAAHTARLAQ
jgi:hypothetical protein